MRSLPVPDLLLRGGLVYDAGAARPSAVAVTGHRITWVGPEDEAEDREARQVLRLGGAWLGPAFVDAHVHLVQTGFLLTQLDLTGCRSLTEALDRLAAFARGLPPDSVVIGSNWDETAWPERRPPTGDELERAAPGLRIRLARVDGHSSVLSHALARAVPGLEEVPGWSPDGRVELEANHALTQSLAALVGPVQRLDAARAACHHLLRHGVVAFHENAAPHIGPEYELDLVRAAAHESGLHATCYWGEEGATGAAERLGVRGLAGDLNADGAIGSRTAALREPYADQPDHRGHRALDPDRIAAHVVACTELGIQAGFHCIGDAAMDAVADGLELAADRVGRRAIRRGRHRLEHVVMPSPRVVEVLADLAVTASVQPMFDQLWGGPGGAYAERLGERWRSMHPFAALEAAGVPLALGSDSPVTPVGPWAAVRAAVHPRTPGIGVTATSAFRAHTRGGWRAAGIEDAGRVQVGMRADLAAWRTGAGMGRDGLPTLDPEAELPRVELVIAGGRTVLDHR